MPDTLITIRSHEDANACIQETFDNAGFRVALRLHGMTNWS